jgi:enolase-phosphatase E1
MIRVVVTDIEGTTSSLAFVKDVLFPYARERLGAYLRAHADEAPVVEQINAVRHEAAEQLAGDTSLEAVIVLLQRWIDEDRKFTPLKALQGLIWEQGYRQGDYRGHIYADAVDGLRRWHEQGIDLYVYSSGSVQAQKLLFAHTAYGDLTPLFRGFFDTRTGAKTDVESYRRIAGETARQPGTIAFLSDVESELAAAQAAGMQTWQLVRDGDPDPDSAYRQARNFTEIEL